MFPSVFAPQMACGCCSCVERAGRDTLTVGTVFRPFPLRTEPSTCICLIWVGVRTMVTMANDP